MELTPTTQMLFPLVLIIMLFLIVCVAWSTLYTPKIKVERKSMFHLNGISYSYKWYRIYSNILYVRERKTKEWIPFKVIHCNTELIPKEERHKDG